jgi:caffeoyl-CoA O-methyltransferase
MNKGYLGEFGSKNETISAYVDNVFQPEDKLLARIRDRAAAAGLPAIHVGRMDGLHLEVLIRAAGARKVVEIGTLAGYSAVCIARGMGSQGKLYTFEFEPKHAEVARRTFEEAGISAQVEVRVGPAVEKLKEIEKHGPFDAVFVDADKVSYPAYLAWATKHLREGGLLIGDNTFAWGMIADQRFDDAEDEAAAKALREFNHQAARGGFFRATLLPTGEGLTVAVKVTPT